MTSIIIIFFSIIVITLIIIFFKRENKILIHENKELKNTHQTIQTEYEAVKNENIKLQAQEESNQRLWEEQAKTHEQMKLQFKDIAQQIFEEKNNTFKNESNEVLDKILSPLKSQINDFKQQIDDELVKERISLKTEIKSMKESNEKIVEAGKAMRSSTDNLTEALKGDTKTQGNWGEILLEKILEESGLRKDQDYILQGKDLQLKHIDTGNPIKPDVIVKLPDHKHIIIDSKVSLTHYEQYCSEPDQNNKSIYLKKFIDSVKQHILDLEKRRYQDVSNLGSPDLVLMFMPIEGAYILATQEKKDLHSFAWDKRVVLICPSTLYATLKTISSMWKMDLQNQNALKIAEEGGKLYDKIVAFITDMDKLGKQMQTTQTTYDDAMNKLAQGTGNILNRTKKLEELGVKASKKIPDTLN